MQDGSTATPPANRDRLRYIDTMRGVAALLVVWLHSVQAFGRVNPESGGSWLIDAMRTTDFGHVGVVVFFLISGFVIPFSLRVDAPAPARTFLVKRFFRIFPAYWLSVPLAAATCFWIWNQPFGGREFAWNFTLLQAVVGYRHAEGVYWTLPVEFVYYFICTALLLTRSLFNPRRVALVSAALFVVFAALVPTFGRPHPPLDYDGAFWFLNLSLMLWGTLYRHRVDASATRSRGDRVANVLFWMLLAGYVVFLPMLAKWTASPFVLAWLWTYVIGFAIFLVGTRVLRIETRVTDWLGRISYSTYLFHVIVFMAIEWWLLQQPQGSLWRTQSFGVYLAGGVAAVLAVATVVHAVVELPGIRLGRRLSRWLEARATGAASATPIA